jgi:uncharacterized membrane protein YeaQ/YmgE (transglycosylase-associated protein family)
MTAHLLILSFHISCGVVALGLGLVAMWATKQRGLHTIVGNIYHWVFLCLAVSACGLAALDWSRLWWYVPIAVGSYALALTGFLAAKIRWNGWLETHLSGQLGSYIAMITALLVVNFGTVWWAWVLPTVIGSPIISWLKREVRAGRRPKYGPRAPRVPMVQEEPLQLVSAL